jgi:hypothetical protein
LRQGFSGRNFRLRRPSKCVAAQLPEVAEVAPQLRNFTMKISKNFKFHHLKPKNAFFSNLDFISEKLNTIFLRNTEAEIGVGLIERSDAGVLVHWSFFFFFRKFKNNQF